MILYGHIHSIKPIMILYLSSILHNAPIITVKMAAAIILVINNKKAHIFKSTVYSVSKEMAVIIAPSILKDSGANMHALHDKLIFLLLLTLTLLLLIQPIQVEMYQYKKSLSQYKHKLHVIYIIVVKEMDLFLLSVQWVHLLDF